MQQPEREQIDENRLVRRAQNGDQEAFNLLVLAHQRFVYNLAVRSVSDPHEAQDISQEAFLRAWMALPSFKARSRFRTWLYRIVVNLCYTRLPGLRRELDALPVEEVFGMMDESRLNPSKAAELSEQRDYLHTQIENLPDSYRMMIVLRYQQGFSYEEIAEILGVPMGTVKTGIHRARKQLREALQTYQEAPA
ncbi:MAG: sigma-70 family RNA polymerase sigma factor [Anaerolineales bacterium]